MRGAVLVILGGSSPWTVDLVERLVPDVVTLVGRDAAALDAIGRFLSGRVETRIETSTDPEGALTSATVVVCQARLGGWASRREDEAGPSRWGHYGDETLGLGGLRSALRARTTLARWAAYAGSAPVVMVSNPTDLLTRWWAAHGGGAAISACEAPSEVLASLPDATRYLGVNHLGWALTPDGERRPTRWLSIPPALAAHVAGQRAAVPRAATLARLSADLRAAIARDDERTYRRLLAARPPFWYASLIAPLLRAMLAGSPFRGVLGLPNRGRLPGLPDDLVVESLGTTTEPDRAAVPTELISDVERLGLGRQRAWEVLCDPSARTVAAFTEVDPFCRAGALDPALVRWVLGV